MECVLYLTYENMLELMLECLSVVGYKNNLLELMSVNSHPSIYRVLQFYKLFRKHIQTYIRQWCISSLPILDPSTTKKCEIF